MRLIDADAISKIMYRKAFEEDSDLQRWDSGCWIRYKMFEQALEEAPTIEAEPVRRGVWDTLSVYGINGRKYTWHACSLCGAQPSELYNYCPNCGAYMEGKE